MDAIGVGSGDPTQHLRPFWLVLPGRLTKQAGGLFMQHVRGTAVADGFASRKNRGKCVLFALNSISCNSRPK